MIAKLVVDFKQIDLNDFVQEMGNRNIDLLFAGSDCVYLYSKSHTLLQFSMIMKEEMKIDNMFLKEIENQEEIPRETLIDTWYREKKAIDEVEALNKEKQ